jgi:molybdopterin converting factor subunit 1
MKVNVKLFAGARELAGCSEIDVELPSDADVGQLRRALTASAPQLAPLAQRSMISVNSQYANDASSVHESDEIALIPPVSGG